MKLILLSLSLLLMSHVQAAENVLTGVNITEITTYDSGTDSDFKKMRLTLDGSTTPGVNPDITDNGADIPCSIYAFTSGAMDLALVARTSGRAVDIVYLANGTEGAECKIRYITLKGNG